MMPAQIKAVSAIRIPQESAAPLAEGPEGGLWAARRPATGTWRARNASERTAHTAGRTLPRTIVRKTLAPNFSAQTMMREKQSEHGAGSVGRTVEAEG
jgi:hypothetical protein